MAPGVDDQGRQIGISIVAAETIERSDEDQFGPAAALDLVLVHNGPAQAEQWFTAGRPSGAMPGGPGYQ